MRKLDEPRVARRDRLRAVERADRRAKMQMTPARPVDTSACDGNGSHEPMPCRPLLALSCAVALAGCADARSDVVAPRSPATEGEDAARTITVMTFNVHRDESGDRATVEAVGAPNADVVCLQEPTEEWERVLRARYAKQYPHMIFEPRDDAGGLAILSRYPLENARIMQVNDWHPAAYALVDTPAGRLQILHVHLRALFDGEGGPLRSYVKTHDDHLSELALFADVLAPRVPTIVVGDFNESPEGPALAWLEARGFQSVLPIFHPRQHTWRGRSVLGGMVMSLDHVLSSPALVPVDAWVPSRGRSDHMPVVARFRVTHAGHDAAGAVAARP